MGVGVGSAVRARFWSMDRRCAPVSSGGRTGGRQITTIEGLGANEEHPLQKAWQEHKVPQCGYCQGGQILSAVSPLLRAKPHPTDEELDAMMAGNICRCGTYPRIRKAIQSVAGGEK